MERKGHEAEASRRRRIAIKKCRKLAFGGYSVDPRVEESLRDTSLYFLFAAASCFQLSFCAKHLRDAHSVRLLPNIYGTLNYSRQCRDFDLASGLNRY
jgi:hypothetical protein